MIRLRLFLSGLALLLLTTACQSAPANPNGTGSLKVVAVESFLADIAQNVAGDRLQIDTLMPLGLDPHAFEPTPQDIAKIAGSQVLIINGSGFESWLDKTLQNAGGTRQVLSASAGLISRQPQPGEISLEDPDHNQDPHFWLDPLNAIQYAENIRAGLTAADPAGAAVYEKNAAEYKAELLALDAWIQEQIALIPAQQRQIVTNHESFGYFADRYGFILTGAIISSASTGSAPSAQEMAQLIDRIRQTGASAIFLETAANPQLARQIAQETGVKVIDDLYTHSISSPEGPAPTYLAMMRHNVQRIVEALK